MGSGTAWHGFGIVESTLGMVCVLVTLLLAGVAWTMRRQAKLQTADRNRERRLREELEAYARLDTSMAQATRGQADRIPAARALAMRVCRTVAEKSAFTRVMVVFRNAEGRLNCVGSIGVDDLTVKALERWGEEVVKEERGGTDLAQVSGSAGVKIGVAKTIPIALGEWENFDPEVSTWSMSGRHERRKYRRAVVLPIRTGTRSALGSATIDGAGRMVGAIVVCTDGMSVSLAPGKDRKARLDLLLNGVELLAARLGTAMENDALSDRLLRAEKMAGLGQLAGGVAHALNNPLTAVLGFAELIAETSSEARVQEDARTIGTEALKMKATVERLLDFWRPSTQADEPVALVELVRKLADGCVGLLEIRGVKLEIVAPPELELVRGSRERLGQVFEHLLNNAAAAISKSRAREEGEEHVIRISLSQDEETQYVIVSDTGTGFEEPGRAFDPFYTTQDLSSGAGLGLSICYGIIREHGGEIAAFNLHPHGAAVVVELPLRESLTEDVILAETRNFAHN